MGHSRLIGLSLLSMIGILVCDAQDVNESGRHAYSSAGFNVSSVSGLGLSYRHHFAGASLLQFSGGILSSGSRTSSALGFEYQYELSKKETFRYYVVAGGGLYSSTKATSALGLGIGLELPILGDVIFESVTGGVGLFYPVAYSKNSGSVVSFGGSLYFFYNF